MMAAHNAEKALPLTYAELPRDAVERASPANDRSSDETLHIARELQLEDFVHNFGYGANQKTCYRKALFIANRFSDQS